MIAADAGGHFHDHRGRENVRPTGREPLFGEAIALREESDGRGAGRNRVTLLLESHVLPRTQIRSFSRGHIVDLEQLAALGTVHALPGSDSCSCSR